MYVQGENSDNNTDKYRSRYQGDVYLQGGSSNAGSRFRGFFFLSR